MSTLAEVAPLQDSVTCWEPLDFPVVALRLMPPGDGEGTGTEAESTTAMPIDVVPGSPALSETVAVMVCEPTDNCRLTELAIPNGPSMLEYHVIRELRFPSCPSVADPESVTVVPFEKEAPLPGELMLTTGAVLVTEFTLIETVLVVLLPVLSVTDA